MQEYVKNFYLNDLGLIITDEEFEKHRKNFVTLYHELIKGQYPSLTSIYILRTSELTRVIRQRGLKIQPFKNKRPEVKNFFKDFDKTHSFIKDIANIVIRSTRRLR